MSKPVIVEALRTPIGRARKGSLVSKDAFELAQLVVRAILRVELESDLGRGGFHGPGPRGPFLTHVAFQLRDGDDALLKQTDRDRCRASQLR